MSYLSLMGCEGRMRKRSCLRRSALVRMRSTRLMSSIFPVPAGFGACRVGARIVITSPSCARIEQSRPMSTPFSHVPKRDLSSTSTYDSSSSSSSSSSS